MFRTVTNVLRKLQNHILVCCRIHSLYRSKILTETLNGLGYCELYKFSLEVKTALVEARDNANTHLTPNIFTGDNNSELHSAWDNLNKIIRTGHRGIPRSARNKKTSYNVMVLYSV